MRRRTIGLLLALAGLLLLAPVTSAGDFEFVGGVTYNTYSLDFDGLEERLDLNTGLGFLGGAHYWLSDVVAVGGQIERLTISGEGSIPVELYDPEVGEVVVTGKSEVEGSSTGFLATVLMEVPTSTRLKVRPFGALGMYKLNATQTLSAPNYTPESTKVKFRFERRFGGKAGVSAGMEIAPGFQLGIYGAYRFISEFDEGDISVDGFGGAAEFMGWDLSGFSAGGSLSYTVSF